MKNFQFKAKPEPIQIGLVQNCIVVPPEIMDQLPKKGRIRVKGTMQGIPFALAIQSMKNGVRYFSVNRELFKKISSLSDGEISIKFHPVDPDELDIPEELNELLLQDEHAAEIWNNFTTGKKRGLIHYLDSAKSIETKVNRAVKIMNKAKAGLLYSQKKNQE